MLAGSPSPWERFATSNGHITTQAPLRDGVADFDGFSVVASDAGRRMGPAFSPSFGGKVLGQQPDLCALSVNHPVESKGVPGQRPRTDARIDPAAANSDERVRLDRAGTTGEKRPTLRRPVLSAHDPFQREVHGGGWHGAVKDICCQ